MTRSRPEAAFNDVADGAPLTLMLPAWNLNDLYSGIGDPAVAADRDRLMVEASAFQAAHRGNIAHLTSAGLAGAIAAYEAIEQGLARLHSFAQLLFSADATRAAAGQFLQATKEHVTTIGAMLLFLPLEINRLDDASFEAHANAPALAHYRPWLNDLRRGRPHQLGDDLEALFQEKDLTGHAAWARLFDETIAAMRIVIGDEAISLVAALDRLSGAERAVRTAAGTAIGAALQRHARLFTLIFNMIAKDKAIEDAWRHYPSPEAARHHANRIEDGVVTALVDAVTSAYPRLSHRYYSLKARWLGLDRLDHWDRNAPLPGDDEPPIGWDEAKCRVLAAYQAFSPELATIGARFFDGGWIDAGPRSGKSGGAFAHPTVPDAHPYILLNYQGRIRDVMTLAHELGHGIHQTLAAGQGYLMAATPLTIAETASVFGEMLVFRAMLNAQPDPHRRRLMLAHKVEDMLNTVIRQIAFFRFEQRLHARRRDGELLTEDIGAIWLEVQRESLGPAFDFADEYRMFWAYVPHFVHAPFYVYAYAFGDCLVSALYGVYQDAAAAGTTDQFTRNYLALLRAGGTRTHTELLAPFGLDASDPAFWQRGLDIIAGFIDELEH